MTIVILIRTQCNSSFKIVLDTYATRSDRALKISSFRSAQNVARLHSDSHAKYYLFTVACLGSTSVYDNIFASLVYSNDPSK